MKHIIKSSELTSEDIERHVSAASRAMRSAVNGELKEVETKIASYESRFHIDSATFRKRIATGELSETWEFCQWLMALHEREKLAARTSPAR